MAPRKTIEPPEGWAGAGTATRMRAWVRAVVLNVLAEERPPPRYGVVQSIDRVRMECQVIHTGDTEAVTVRMFETQPSAEGQIVRVDGLRDDRFISNIVDGISYRMLPINGIVETLTASPDPVAGHAWVALDATHLLAAGGSNDLTTITDAANIYDTDTDTWSPVSPLPVGLVFTSGAIGPDGMAYVAGGATSFGGGGVDTMYQYDPGLDTWTAMTPMPGGTRGYAGSCLASDGLIYVAGGSDGSPLDRVERYDTTTDTWAMMANLPAPITWGFNLVSIGDKLYFSGLDGVFVMHLYEYDIPTDSWVELTPASPDPFIFPASAAYNGSLILFGGLSYYSTVSDHIEGYDPTTATWTLRGTLPDTMYGGAAALCGDAVYVFGGVPISGYSFPTAALYKYQEL